MGDPKLRRVEGCGFSRYQILDDMSSIGAERCGILGDFNEFGARRYRVLDKIDEFGFREGLAWGKGGATWYGCEYMIMGGYGRARPGAAGYGWVWVGMGGDGSLLDPPSWEGIEGG